MFANTYGCGSGQRNHISLLSVTFNAVKIHSRYLTVGHEPVEATDSARLSFYSLSSFASWSLPTSPSWLSYHDLTPTIIKGQDIEL